MQCLDFQFYSLLTFICMDVLPACMFVHRIHTGQKRVSPSMLLATEPALQSLQIIFAVALPSNRALICHSNLSYSITHPSLSDQHLIQRQNKTWRQSNVLQGDGGKRINQRTGMKTPKVNTKTYFKKIKKKIV